MTRPRAAELLEAYASGAALSDEERAAVEVLLAQSADARADVAATRDLIDALRAAAPEPPPASEAMVRAVRLACAAPVPWSERTRAWLRRRWTLAVPVALAAAAAIVLARPSPSPSPSPSPPIAVVPTPTPPPGPLPAPSPAAAPALWLDGDATALDALDPAAADAIDDELAAELAGIDGLELDGDGDGDGLVDGLLPTTDLGWVDALDDAAAAELDRWLAEQPS